MLRIVGWQTQQAPGIILQVTTKLDQMYGKRRKQGTEDKTKQAKWNEEISRNEKRIQIKRKVVRRLGPGTNDAKIIWKIVWNQKRKAELKSDWAPLVRLQKQAWEIPIPLDYCFFFFLMPKHLFYQKNNLIMG